MKLSWHHLKEHSRTTEAMWPHHRAVCLDNPQGLVLNNKHKNSKVKLVILWCNFPSLMDHHHEFLELLGGVRLLFREFPWFCNVTEPAIYTREQAFGGQFCHPWGHQACLIINTYGDESASHPGPISLLCLMMIMMMAHKNGDADSIWENLKTYDAYDSRGVHHLKTQSSKEWVQSSQWYLLERLNNL